MFFLKLILHAKIMFNNNIISYHFLLKQGLFSIILPKFVSYCWLGKPLKRVCKYQKEKDNFSFFLGFGIEET